MRMMGRFFALLLASTLLHAPGAPGELQNVEVNGGCFMPAEDRMAEAVFVPCGEGVEGFPVVRLSTPAQPNRRARSAMVRLDYVSIPPMPEPEQYSYYARVFLSFYVGVPQWTHGDAGKVDVTVSIDNYRVFQCELSEPGWHPWLVDAAPWAGRDVAVRFSVGWLEGEPHETVVALPRTVACHGPYYKGIGGISSGRGPHGMPLAWGGRSGGGMDDAANGKDALALLRLDAIQPSTVRLSSAGNGYDAALTRGLYWLPLALDREAPDIRLETLSGLAERGPMDIVPNFLAGDEALLAQLTRNLSASE